MDHRATAINLPAPFSSQHSSEVSVDWMTDRSDKNNYDLGPSILFLATFILPDQPEVYVANFTVNLQHATLLRSSDHFSLPFI